MAGRDLFIDFLIANNYLFVQHGIHDKYHNRAITNVILHIPAIVT